MKKQPGLKHAVFSNTKTPELTEVGVERLNHLYTFLGRKRAIIQYLRHVTECKYVDPETGIPWDGESALMRQANIGFDGLFTSGFYWADTPEGFEYWYDLNNQFREYYEEIELELGLHTLL